MPVVETVNEISEYEKLRARNIEENKRMLESLGLLRAFKPILQPIKKKIPAVPKVKPPVKRKYEETKTDVNASETEEDNNGNHLRRSSRAKKKPEYFALASDDDDDEAEDEDEWKEEQRAHRREVRRQSHIIRKPKVQRDNSFGAIEGVPVGTHWDSRIQCSDDGVHRPTVAGIHGNEARGCFSLALSGGYEDDLDLGDSFTYTGSGGRDLKGTAMKPKNLRTAPQSSDQRLEKGNLALSLNVKSRKPVRVIRGFKCPSAFAPEYGYRYDGLYTVEKYWSAVGMSGFMVWKFVLKRVADQAPPPWTESLAGIQEEDAKDVKEEDVKEEDVKGEDVKGEDVKEDEVKEDTEKEEKEEKDECATDDGPVVKDEPSDEENDDTERVVKRRKGDA